MELPKKIKIAGIDVKVIDWDHREADKQEAYGLFSEEESCIKIDTTGDNLRVIDTLIHELLHGIWAGYHMDDKDKEERTVATMASALTQVFRDNPELLNLFKSEVQDNMLNYEEGPVEASDMVNHPPHYTGHPSGIECIQVTEHMRFCIGNAVKYLWRADLKGHATEDLKKAKWYIEREIEKRTKETP